MQLLASSQSVPSATGFLPQLPFAGLQVPVLQLSFALVQSTEAVPAGYRRVISRIRDFGGISQGKETVNAALIGGSYALAAKPLTA